jgi:trimeric autotransporter adhesin
MKTPIRNALVALALFGSLLQAAAQGTAFTYQGQLQNNGSLASGTYNLQFSLYTANSGGSLVAGPVTNNSVLITNGLFTVTMDFGSSVWNGATNWLQIGVETNGVSGFTPLTPRQQLTPAPYAIYAEGADAAGLLGTIPATNLGGTYGNALTLTNPANSFSGNGTGLTNVNAATLGGLAPGSFWQVGGNAGVPSSNNFIGTLDNNFIDVRVSNIRGLRLRLFNDALGIYTNAPNVIGGSSVNLTAPDVVGATIAGGGGNNTNGTALINEVYADFGAIGGGAANSTGAQNATVSGGYGNNAGGTGSFIGGGGYDGTNFFGNTIQDVAATIGGGMNNTIPKGGNYAFIGGGYGNNAGGLGAMVGGGEGNIASGYATTVGGGYGNRAEVYLATVAGGGGNIASTNTATVGGGANNVASGQTATVSGGIFNYATGSGSFVGGGGYDGSEQIGNQAQAPAATIGGGQANIISDSGSYAFIGGGDENTNSGYGATVGGGLGNTASGYAATIPGGAGNTASGYESFACGSFANSIHDYSFVWGDDEIGAFSSTRQHQFAIQAANGVYMSVSASSGLTPAALEVDSSSTNGVAIYATQNSSGAAAVLANSGTGNIISGFSGPSADTLVFKVENDGTVVSKGATLTSDRNAKDNFTSLDGKAVLAKVAALPVTEWNYKDDPADKKHIGPVAQDFHATFGLNGDDDHHISILDEGGVALAAIQGLNQKLTEKDSEILSLKRQNEALAKRLENLEQTMKSVAELIDPRQKR